MKKKILLPIVIVGLLLSACASADTQDETQQHKQVLVDESSKEADKEVDEDNTSEDEGLSSSAYEYQQLESILRLLKEETDD